MKPRGPSGRNSGLFTAAVSGDSMLPALRNGDWLLVRRGRAPAVGDVVVVRDPRLPERLMVKRVAGRLGSGWWVLGDNPAASTDSRSFGAVPPQLVLGRVVLRYWPRPWFLCW